MGDKPLRPPRCSFVWMTLAICLLFSSASSATEPTPGVKLLTHGSIDASSLNISTLRAIFSLRKRSWDNKTPIKVFVLPDNHPLHKRFCKSVLRVYPYVLRDQWDRVIFSGAGTPPTIVKDAEELRRAVQSTPGAIGYLPQNDDQAFAGRTTSAKHRWSQ